MAMVDPFTPDAFSLTTLTAAINNLKYQPGRLGQLGLFNEQGINTLSAQIEEQDGVLSLVDIAPRGGPGQVVTGGSRKIHSFAIPHMPERASLMADEIQGVRAFGSESQAEMLTNRVNERLAMMRRNLEYTLESHRVAALMGNYYDVNGASTSLFTTFGVSQTTQSMALSSSATSKAREKATIVLEAIESALDGVPFSGVRVFCSSGFWKALIEDKDAKETYLNTQMAASLRNDPRLEFNWNGFTFERYRGTSSVKIADNVAYAVPEGVPNLFVTRFAPANYNETVNTVGLPIYAKGEQMKFGKGWELEAQSNALNLCTRPASIIKLTIS
jgi:hypothetical protein